MPASCATDFSELSVPQALSDRRARRSLRRWRSIHVAFLLFAAVVGAYYVGVKGESRSAINRWRPTVRELWTGVDVYAVRGFPTPPVMPILLTPFAALDGKGAMAAWFLFKAAATALVLAWMLRVADQLAGGLPTWAAAAGLALAARPVMGDLLHGNVNLWILFLVVAAVICYRSGRDVAAGLLLALAIACKLTPALLAAYFAWKREWRLTAATAVGLALWLFFVPAAFLGWDRNLSLLEHWADYMVWPYAAEGKVETLQTNQSAAALLYRLFTHTDVSQTPWRSSFVAISVADVDPDKLGWIWLGLVGILMLGLGWICRGRVADRRGWRLWHELGLVMLAMLLVSERSWKHHFVWLLPIGLVLAASAVRLGRSLADRRRAWWIWGATAAAFLLMLATSPDAAKAFFGDSSARTAQAWGAYVWAALVLGFAHLVALDPPAESTRTASAPSN
jgi:hypothetical protein